jgi:hypothetical protein
MVAVAGLPVLPPLASGPTARPGAFPVVLPRPNLIRRRGAATSAGPIFLLGWVRRSRNSRRNNRRLAFVAKISLVCTSICQWMDAAANQLLFTIMNVPK